MPTPRKDHPFRNSASAKVEHLSDIQLAYIAGLFDGEGTVGIYETKLPCRLGGIRPAWHFEAQIANTYWPVIQWMLDNVGGNSALKSKGKEHWRQGYVWRMTGANAEFFMSRIRPFTVIKGPQIDLALSFRSKFKQPRRTLQSPEIIAEKRRIVQELKDLKRA